MNTYFPTDIGNVLLLKQDETDILFYDQHTVTITYVYTCI